MLYRKYVQATKLSPAHIENLRSNFSDGTNEYL